MNIKKIIARKGFIILTALLIVTSSSLCYGASNDDYIALLSKYKDRIEQIINQLDAGGSSLTEDHAREEAAGVISGAIEALYGLKRDIDLEIFKRK